MLALCHFKRSAMAVAVVVVVAVALVATVVQFQVMLAKIKCRNTFNNQTIYVVSVCVYAPNGLAYNN